MISRKRTYTTLPAADMDRAKAWYAEKLGLSPASESEVGSVYDLGGGSGFLLYPTPSAGQAPNTMILVVSDDVKGDVAALKAKGVAFEEYDMAELKTVDSIASFGTKSGAWFKDSEGNIWSIGSDPH
jgi:catechol 2,3-dioxygenase-like lactoylglutathione lyase family enzyme